MVTRRSLFGRLIGVAVAAPAVAKVVANAPPVVLTAAPVNMCGARVADGVEVVYKAVDSGWMATCPAVSTKYHCCVLAAPHDCPHYDGWNTFTLD